MRVNRKVRWRAAVLSMAMLVSTMLLVLGPARPAQADPPCQTGGVYVLWVRGSGQWFNEPEAMQFKQHVNYALDAAGIGNHDWAELGNLDANYWIDRDGPDYEYPAVPVSDWNAVNVINGVYAGSVTNGTDELVRHLNHRYGNGPGDRNCSNETAIIGGYSQGADVIGWALERNGGGGYVTLSAAAKNHIGFVALYGDPKYRGPYSTTSGCPVPMWVRANTTCIGEGVRGVLQARHPYLPSTFYHRTGSWCDNGDGICNWLFNMSVGNHTSTYRDYWIRQSAQEIATAAIFKRNQLNGVSGNARLVCDANGDGKSDAIVMFGDTGTAKVSLSGGSSFGYPGDWSHGQLRFASDYKCADVSGDGKADLIAYFRLSKTWFVSTSSGSGFWPPTEWAYDGSLLPDRTFFADMNGDSKADKIFYAGGSWWVGLSSGSGFWTPQQWRNGHGIGSTDQFVGDFNGDGKADAAVYFAASGNWHVGLSTGSGLGYPGQWSAGHGLGSTFRLAGDTTGDGKADAAYYSNSIHKYWVGSSSGGGFWSLSEWSYDGPGYNNLDNAFLADVTGDSKADKVLWYRGTGNWYVGASSGGGFWPLGQWISGHGANS